MHFRQLLLGCVLGTAALVANAASPYNPWLADSQWSQVHGGPWQQDSSTAAGPTSAAQLGDPQFELTGVVNIAPLLTPPYPNGQRAYWGGSIDKIYKVAVVNGQLKTISSVDRAGDLLSNTRSPFAGAYTAVRYDNTYLTGSVRTILAYSDTNPNDINSPIRLYKSYTIPKSIVPDLGTLKPDFISGMNLLFDGKIVVATRGGYVGVVDIENGRAYFKKVGNHSKGGLQNISNSVAVAADGGIYVVSNEEMYRFQWVSGSSWETSSLKSPVDDAATCASCWRQGYPVAEQAPGTLGSGSGSTPSLMGPNGEYVVITDGAKVANLSVYRTGALAPGQSRLAAAIPVNFGNPNRTQTASEQSVVVTGYGMAVVSNDYTDPENIGSDIPFVTSTLVKTLLDLPILANIEAARVTLLGYGPKHQPWGVQKFSFDPARSQLRSDWVRTDVSCPNSIPIVSEPSRRFYCVGAKDLNWTIESLNWDTGQDHFRKNLGILPRFNSFYAQTQLAAEGGMIYGSFDGVVYVPAPAQLKNVALGKAAYQSSTDWGGDASRAVDGNTNGNWGGNSVTHTAAGASPSWVVLLGSKHNIDGVTIWNRTDCCTDRLRDFYVVAKNGGTTVATAFHAGTISGSSVRLNLKGSNVDRVYVYPKYSDANSILSLAEVQVWGEPTSALTNVAQGKSAWQTSTAHGGDASRAVDGNTSGNYWDNSVTHTEFGGNQQWGVNLGRSYTVKSVTVWNRTDCCTERLADFAVSVYDKGVLKATTYHPGTLKGSSVVVNVSADSADQVIVWFPNSNGGTVASLAEVQVWGR